MSMMCRPMSPFLLMYVSLDMRRTNFLQVDGLSTDPRGSGCHTPRRGTPFQVQDMCKQTMLLRSQHEAGRILALIHVLYIILEYVSFNIMFCIKSDVITLGGFGDIDCIYMDK